MDKGGSNMSFIFINFASKEGRDWFSSKSNVYKNKDETVQMVQIKGRLRFHFLRCERFHEVRFALSQRVSENQNF